MRRFFRWLFGTDDEFDFKREFAKAMEAAPPGAVIDLPPGAVISKPSRDEEARWPSLHREAVVKTITAHKHRAPRRTANAKPAAKSRAKR